MDIRDLMVGDIVRIQEGVVTVTAIGWYIDGEQVVYCKGDSYGIYRNVEDIKPQPIYVGLLENNGFKQRNGAEVWDFQEGKTEIHIVPNYFYDDTSVTLIIERKDNRANGCAKVDINIRFFHELQHFMRLCGVKKQIQL